MRTPYLVAGLLLVGALLGAAINIADLPRTATSAESPSLIPKIFFGVYILDHFKNDLPEAVEASIAPEPEPVPVLDEKEQRCLAKAIYFEARNQDIGGKLGVAAVVMNRVKVGVHPNSICEVVHQGCQFSWNCQPSKQYSPAKHKNSLERDAWDEAISLASYAIIEYNENRFIDLTKGATFFHAKYVKPKWSRWSKLERTVRLGDHIFYRVKADANQI